MDIEEIRKHRTDFLKAVYDKADGDQVKKVNCWEIGESFGFDKAYTDRIVQYLKGEGFVKFRTMGGSIAISHRGVKEVERDL